MSSCGIHAVITSGKPKTLAEPCLLIGEGVPRIHHSDGIPVYLVIESEEGIPILQKNGRIKHLLAYPSHWSAPGKYNHDHWLHGSHEHLAWHALIPCFDGETTDD